MEEDPVRDKIESVVQQVNAIRDTTQPAQRPKPHDGGNPSAGIGYHRKQQYAVQQSEPRVSDRDGDNIHRMHQPPQQRTHPHEKNQQCAPQRLRRKTRQRRNANQMLLWCTSGITVRLCADWVIPAYRDWRPE